MRAIIKLIFIVICLTALSANAQQTEKKKDNQPIKNESQKNYFLTVHSANPILSKIKFQKKFISPEERNKEIKTILFDLYDDAYLAATVDSLVQDSNRLTAYITTGEIYKWAKLDKGNVSEAILSQIGFREKLYSNKPLYFKDVVKVQDKILTYAENNGFPFASVKLDSIKINGNEFSAKLNYTKNKVIRIDSIVVKGKVKISTRYLYNYLNIKPGDLYNESIVKKISARLRELPFLRETKPLKIIFSDKTTKIYLFLDSKKASKFDGIIGFLPDPVTGKLILTGDVKLNLENAIGKGEQIDFDWQRLKAQTQNLTTHLSYPFLFSTPFGFSYDLKLYKQDSTYIQVDQTFALQYLLSGGDYFKVFVEDKSSTLLSTSGLEYQTVLPTFADNSITSYGIGYKTERLDYRLNPRKGFALTVDIAAGNKTIKVNPNLNPIVYDNLKLSSNQYNADLNAAFFMPIGTRSTIKYGLQSAYLYGASLFQNDLFRIGGLTTLRGFDQQSIYASSYVVGTIEYRYLLEQNSYLYTFFDQAYYQNQSINHNIWDTPFGFGAGISFQTKAGIFSINYALGKQFNNPIDVRAGKISFGIVSYF
ncbi:MAG TPA: POTRA domain-containing protein [Bacteroidia bacterium]|nr:POTRA domain-containing protein [Bacteroidia bacterium]